MGFLPVKKFQWYEPEAYRVEQDRAAADFCTWLWWLRPSCIFIFTVANALIGWANKTFLHKDSNAGSPLGVGIMFGAGVFLLYGMPWLLRRLPASVTLYSTGIMKMGDQNIHPFKGMSGFNWLQKGSYYVLNIVTPKGRILSYGVPDPMTRDKIEAILGQTGLSKISTPAKPDFAVRRKAIWGQRVFTASEVEAMCDEERNV